MNLTSMPTAELVRAACDQAQAGSIADDILKELGIRYVYRGCPAEDKAMIAGFDRAVVIPLFGFTKLPPETIHLPGTKKPTVPAYYQMQQVKGPGLSEKSASVFDSTKSVITKISENMASKKIAQAFISYSHKDADLLTQLHEHLSALQRQQLLDTWTDREIHAGGIIDHQIDEQMEKADLYLLLVSSAFIQSDYCFQKEFALACKRQQAGEAIIVPIIVRECDWKIPALRKFKALPEDAKPVISRHWHTPDEAFANIAAGLRVLLEKG